MSDTETHGDINDYRRHKRRGETPCDKCKAAHVTYIRERLQDPARRLRHYRIVAADQRARTRLVEMYRDDFARLAAEERERIPLPPMQDRRRTDPTTAATA